MGSVTFHYAQIRSLDFFVRGKPVIALQTFATTTDTGAIPRLTGIDDLVITRPALGATHSMGIAITTLSVVVSTLLSIFFMLMLFLLPGLASVRALTPR